MILLFLLFQVKHFLADFLFQTKYQYSNKGKFMHPGGLLHCFIHGIGTILVLYYFCIPEVAVLLGILDAILHYVIDYSKTNLVNKYKWCYRSKKELVITSNMYYVARVIDQLLHQFTYLLILSIL